MRQILFLVISAVTLLITIGCDDKATPPYTLYSEEIEYFIKDSEDGKELFTQNLYPDESFTVGDTMEIFYTFDSVIRERIVLNIYDPQDLYGLSDKYSATADITDIYYGRLNRIEIDDTASYDLTINLNRSAFFIKLYNDNYPAHGWIFWRYDMMSKVPDATIDGENGLPFSTNDTGDFAWIGPSNNYYYLLEDFIPRYNRNDDMTLEIDRPEVIFTRNAGNTLVPLETSLSGGDNIVSWRAPSATSDFFHLITINGAMIMDVDTTFDESGLIIRSVDTSFIKNEDFVLPFKLI